jgi:DNA-3-methyladenine glycosylase I
MTDTNAITVGDDGVARCAWGFSTPEYRVYHDTEWGFPVIDDRRIFEKICLEGFQAGLSWLTILRKRENFRQAFAGFDPVAVAGFDEADVERLLADPGIVRNRAKVLATIANAQATIALADDGISLAELVWRYRPADERVPEGFDDIASTTPESKALSAELRRRGFKFVGPTTVYAAMQSLGVVDDHLAGCAIRAAVERARTLSR